MPDTGADAAQRYREHMRSKAERLAEGEDAKHVDASDFEPAEKLYAGVKTGMRPVSRQARQSGGAVMGTAARATPGRAPRKAGGGVGESYVNRDQKAANAEREGEYPNGGMQKGGRAHRAEGGDNWHKNIRSSAFEVTPRKAPTSEDLARAKRDTDAYLANRPKSSDDDEGMRRGGRTKRAEGGYIPREGGPSETRELRKKTASGAVERNGRPAAEDGRQGRASGGRVARQAGGPLATPLAAGMGGQGRMNFNFGPQQATGTRLGIKDGGRAKAHERYGHGPSCSCPSCRKGKAGGGALSLISPLAAAIEGGDGDSDDNKPAYAPGSPGNTGGKRHGGRAKRAAGGAAPGPAENLSGAGQPSFKHRAPKGENSSRARTLAEAKARADGGEVAEGALKQHRLEHKALGKAKGGGFRTASGEVSAEGRRKAEAKGETMPGGGFPIRNKADLANAKQSLGRAKHPAAARTWIDKRAKQLGEPPVGKAAGGKAGKGKTNINIIIGTGRGGPPPPGDPSQNPQLGIRPPPAAAPMPMPAPGGAPGAPGAMPMPIPVPMGGGAPGAGMPPPGMMPPRARGGRAPKVGGEPEAGSGSGLGRLQKTAEYGRRSREGEGMRK